jgi:hypothetical protein
MAVDVPLPALPANPLDRVLRYRVCATLSVVGAELLAMGRSVRQPNGQPGFGGQSFLGSS